MTGLAPLSCALSRPWPACPSCGYNRSMTDLRPILKDFINAVTPDPQKGPLEGIHDRYEERQQERLRLLHAAQPIGYPKGSPEYMVEFRIREWVRRMEAEKAEMERIRAQGRADAPPQKKPPAPK